MSDGEAVTGIWAVVIEQIQAMSWLEVSGVAFGIISVWLTVKENPWAWIVGSVSSVLLAVLLFSHHIYGDATLQVLYIVLNLLGLAMWLRGGRGGKALVVAHATPRLLAVVALATAAGIGVLGWSMLGTPNTVPWLDASTTGLSLAATYLLSRKLILNWPIWITANVIYIYLYWYKGMYLLALQQPVFIAMSLAGWTRWMRLERERNPG